MNIDVYRPEVAGAQVDTKRKPVIIIACGGGGKDPTTGSPLTGKHAAGYHDLGEALSRAGFWAIIPSRRGDPKRTPQMRDNLAPQFHRLPEELFQDQGPNDGGHSHRRHVAELAWLVENLHSIFGPYLDVRRVGILGKSAGGGVALAAAAQLGERIASVALWGSALRTSSGLQVPRPMLSFPRCSTEGAFVINVIHFSTKCATRLTSWVQCTHQRCSLVPCLTLTLRSHPSQTNGRS